MDEKLLAEAALLTDEQRTALRPCATDRQCLLKAGLAHWKTKPGHRYPSISLNSRGYKMREALGLNEKLSDLPVGDYVYDVPYLEMRLRMRLTGKANPTEQEWAAALRKHLDEIGSED